MLCLVGVLEQSDSIGWINTREVGSIVSCIRVNEAYKSLAIDLDLKRSTGGAPCEVGPINMVKIDRSQ